MSFNPSKFASISVHFNVVLKTLEQYGSRMNWPRCKNLKMVDIGSGPGSLLLEVEKKLPRDYTEILCLDQQKEMVEYFRSIPKDSRVKNSVYDIESKAVPEGLENRFDFAFSSYCLSFVRNFSQVFKNCNNLLKNEGEMFLIWAKIGHIYEVYQKMNRSDKWSKYTQDFKDWKQPFLGEKSSELLISMLEKHGFEILQCDDLNDNAFSHETSSEILEIYASLDKVSERIPKEDLMEYRNDFNEYALENIRKVEYDPNGLIYKHIFPSISVAARKIKSV